MRVMNSINISDKNGLLDFEDSQPRSKRSKIKLKPKQRWVFSGKDAKLTDISEILKLAFVNTHTKLLENEFDSQLSGATCTSIVISDTKAYIANVGDSRIVVGRRNPNGSYSALQLSNDHKPDLPEEYDRITQSKGRVFPFYNREGNPLGPHRVWHPDHNYPGLAMSRSLGDYIAHDYGVSEEPEVTTYKIQKQDQFLILASDGVWEFMTNQEVIDIISDNIFESCRQAADVVIERAYNQWVSPSFTTFKANI